MQQGTSLSFTLKFFLLARQATLERTAGSFTSRRRARPLFFAYDSYRSKPGPQSAFAASPVSLLRQLFLASGRTSSSMENFVAFNWVSDEESTPTFEKIIRLSYIQAFLLFRENPSFFLLGSVGPSSPSFSCAEIFRDSGSAGEVKRPSFFLLSRIQFEWMTSTVSFPSPVVLPDAVVF